MKFFRKTKKPVSRIWVMLLSVALLCAQGVNLHVHSIDHDHDQQFSHNPDDGVTQHSHLSAAHPSIDISHADQHDTVVSEIDGNPDGLSKKVSRGVPPVLALLAALFALFLVGRYQAAFHPCRGDGDVLASRCYHLSPPLRAPPR